MRLANLLRSQGRTANEAPAIGAATHPAIEAATPPLRRARRPGWWSQRREVRLAARRAYARMRTRPTSLSRMAEAAVAAISGLAYAISYASLYDLAQHHNFHGQGEWESIAWPTTVDLASLATGIIGLDRASRGKSAWLAGLISAVAAAIMVAGNVAANLGDSISMLMHAWPPVIALACWYMLVRSRRDDANDRGLLEDEPEPANDAAGSSLSTDSPTPRPNGRRPDPRVLRLARAGRDWKAVAAATGLGEHAAKRALTAARKQIANDSHALAPSDSPGTTGQEVAA